MWWRQQMGRLRLTASYRKFWAPRWLALLRKGGLGVGAVAPMRGDRLLREAWLLPGLKSSQRIGRFCELELLQGVERQQRVLGACRDREDDRKKLTMNGLVRHVQIGSVREMATQI